MEPKLTIMCGLPRSGKTTIAKSFQVMYAVRLSPDDIRQALHGKAFEPRAEAQVWAMTETMARAFLIADQHVIVDATFIRKAHRQRWAAIAAEFGLPLEIFWVDTGYYLCLERNHGEGAVPEEVLERMLEHFEMPTSDEGDLVRFDGNRPKVKRPDGGTIH